MGGGVIIMMIKIGIILLLGLILVSSGMIGYSHAKIPNLPPIPNITECQGVLFTIPGTMAGEEIIGTIHNDVILGYDGSDTIHGNEGDDIICGMGGNDTIHAGAGVDIINGGVGHDICYIEAGIDEALNCEEILYLDESHIGDVSTEPYLIGPITYTDAETDDVLTGDIFNLLVGGVVGASVDVTNQQQVPPGPGQPERIQINLALLNEDGSIFTSNGGSAVIPSGQTRTLDTVLELKEFGGFPLRFLVAVENPNTGITTELFTETNTMEVGPPPPPPIPTETFTASNPRVQDVSNGDIIRTIEINGQVRILVDINNDQSLEQPVAIEAQIFKDNILIDTVVLEQILSPLRDGDIGPMWMPLKNGNHSITINIFDNLTDRNSLIPEPLTITSFEVTGEDEFTTRELEKRIAALEALVIQLQAEIEALKGN